LKDAKFILPWTHIGEDFWKQNFPQYVNKIFTVPAGIDTSLFYPEKKTISTSVRILLVGRCVPYKNHDQVLLALSELILENKISSVKLHILGEGPTKPSLFALAKKLRLKSIVSFLPRTTYTKMRYIYSSYDFLILPSFNEAIGMCVPESMACGTACVVSDTVGAEMYVSHKSNGYIYKTGDIQELKKAILHMSNKSVSQKYGANASNHIRTNYSVETVAKKFRIIINGLLE
jgi:glycosyltransferase involved in cell wall biosynthesis